LRKYIYLDCLIESINVLFVYNALSVRSSAISLLKYGMYSHPINIIPLS